MASDKTPGTDGLPAEFYKLFWEDIEGYLLNALNGAYEKRCLSISQRRGLITLLPKKKKRNKQTNEPGITLPNCHYKIATKSIANRIQKSLPNIINNDQAGFLKNRFIGENIRLIESIINHTNIEQIQGLLLFVDFEKTFDSIKWSFIEKTLRHSVNFETSLVSWVKLFYTHISSCVLNDGWASDFFSLHHGVRQVCPLSPYVFIVGAEILGNALRRDTEIRGIKLGYSECKLSQYAEDTRMILHGSERSISRTLYVLDIFANVSGLKANYGKTETPWIGSHKNTK